MKKKKSKESLWLNKPVFGALLFLTFSSLVTSCSLLQTKKTPNKEPVIVNIPNASERILLACDEVNELFVCDRLN